jgi:hypothetical protein
MEEILENQKPFNQVPSWDSTEKFELTGVEFEQIYNFINIFIPPINCIQSVFNKGIADGRIRMKYEYTDGSGEVEEQEVIQYTKALNEYFKNKILDQEKEKNDIKLDVEKKSNLKIVRD